MCVFSISWENSDQKQLHTLPFFPTKPLHMVPSPQITHTPKIKEKETCLRKPVFWHLLYIPSGWLGVKNTKSASRNLQSLKVSAYGTLNNELGRGNSYLKEEKTKWAKWRSWVKNQSTPGSSWSESLRRTQHVPGVLANPEPNRPIR